MVRLDLEIDSFCIDRTEVTRAHYAAFVADGAPTPAARPEACAESRDHVPDSACASSAPLCQGDGCGDHPQTCVNYCDAVAFCEWAGKELNGVLKETNPESKSITAYAQGGAAFEWSGNNSCGGVFSLGGVDDRQPFIGFRCCKNVR